MIEDRRVKAGHLAHQEMGSIVRVTTTEGVEIRDVLVGAVYGSPADRRMLNALGTPDGPNLLLAFAKTGPYSPQGLENRYFEVAADSIAIIYREGT